MRYIPKNFPCNMNLDFEDSFNSMSIYEKLCYVKTLIDTYSALVESFNDRLNQKEDSTNITDNRKLSPTGNFTGTWFDTTFNEIYGQLLTAINSIRYISSEYNSGLGGLILDGGGIDETTIASTYDGGQL